MSPSPQQAGDPRATQAYGRSWQATIQLVRSGSSWSGHERNVAFLNCANPEQPVQTPSRFADISAVSGLDFSDDGRALAHVDWDQDGDLDLWFRNRTAPRLRLMRNRAEELNSRPAYVSLRLQGTTCNRDAVGARAELLLENVPDGERLVQSVRAGDAFLSQSSKWVHFGIGQMAKVAGLIVHWPGGGRERFTGVSNGGRFEVKQGTGRAVRLKPRASVSLPGKPYEVLPESQAARIVLPGRIPLPTLEFLDQKGSESMGTSRGFRPDGKPTLMTFWISSCPHCGQELADFARHHAKFEKQGLRLLAVCLDELGESEEGSVQPKNYSQQLLDPKRFPFASAKPTADSIDRIRNFQNALFSKHPKFVVPFSLLVDAKGQIVSIYRGKFSSDVMLRDASLPDVTDETRRKLARPLGGTWITQPATRSQSAEYIGKRLVGRDPEEGLRYYELAMTWEPDAPRKTRLRQQIVTSHLSLANASIRIGDAPQAARHFDAAIRIAPNMPKCHYDYGVFLMGRGNLRVAEQHFRTALRLRPDYAAAQKSLDVLIQQKGG